QHVTYRKGPSNTGPWALINRVVYTYHDGTDANGNLNDIKTATQQLYNGSSWDDVATSYYRYYKPGDADGFAHGLKLDIGSEGYRRAFNASINFDSASDATLKDYADHYFEYDPSTRSVTLEIAA